MTRPSFEVADVLREHLGAYRAARRLSPAQHKAVRAIMSCRTAALPIGKRLSRPEDGTGCSTPCIRHRRLGFAGAQGLFLRQWRMQDYLLCPFIANQTHTIIKRAIDRQENIV
jgi:hypothetical protein